MNEQELINNASFYYSLNLLRMLLGMGAFNTDEYERICKISAKHYQTKIIYF